MSHQQHIIKRQVVELELPPGLDNLDIQERVARICREEVLVLLDRFLSRTSLPGSRDQIDCLELDLGSIHINDIEQLFIEKIETELQEKLAGISSVPEAMAVQEAKNGPGENRSDLDLVTYYLRTGLMPWWAREASRPVFQKALEALLEKDAAFVRRLFSALFDERAVLERLIGTCGDELLNRLARLYWPGKGTDMAELEAGLLRSSGAGQDKQRFREIWWYSLFKTSADERISAGRYDLETVVRLFTGFMAEQGSRPRPPVLTTLTEDQARLLAKIFDCKVPAAEPGGAPVTNEGAGLPSAPGGISKEGNEALLKSCLTEISRVLARIKAQEAAGGEISQSDWLEQLRSLLRELGREIQDKTQRKKYLAAAGSFLAFPERSGESGKALKKREWQQVKKKLEALQHALRKLDRETQAGAAPENPSAQGRAKENRYDPFSQSDKIHIQNAGLVLLWPFLARFFSNLGLGDDTSFANEAAAQKACLMLQYLVEGTTDDLFEGALPLNKVLCGIDLQQPVNTQWTISPDEAAAAEHFLEAVIQNGPLWKTLSVEGFQRTYLQREGLLSARDGAWLLQVARETYDIIIDRLPWTVQHVKLPWMERMIFTEWQKT